jgi:nucleoside phosphorylase
MSSCAVAILSIWHRGVRRSTKDDSLAIHYGLTASANQLMKDATVRDAPSKEKGILCFGMEAAGLTNHFPCMVVCGICDHADSRKIRQWQGYAATAVATYTEELFGMIALNKVEHC